MNADIDILRQQLEETRDALRHTKDYAEVLKNDTLKLEEDNQHLIDELFVAEEKVAAYEVCGAGNVVLKPIDEMDISELVGLADSAKRLLRTIKHRVLVWCCDAPAH